MKTPRNPPEIHAPLGPYAHQIEITGAERWLVLSGQVGMNADSSVPDGAAEQFDVALANVLHNVSAAGMRPGDVVKLTFYFVDDVSREERSAALRKHFGEVQPCMTLVYVPRLAAPPIKVEVDAWAVS